MARKQRVNHLILVVAISYKCVVPENIHTPRGGQRQKFLKGVGGSWEALFPEGEERCKD